MVGGVNDSILESTRVLQVQMDLAVLGLVGLGGLWADVGLECIKTEGNELRSQLVDVLDAIEMYYTYASVGRQ